MAATYQPTPTVKDREAAVNSFIQSLQILFRGLRELTAAHGMQMTVVFRQVISVTGSKLDVTGGTFDHLNAVLEGANVLGLSEVKPFNAADLGELRRQCIHLIVNGLTDDLMSFLLGELVGHGLSREHAEAVCSAQATAQNVLDLPEDQLSTVQGN